MSECGTFITEYIYCEKCLHEAKKILIARHKHLCSELIEAWKTIPERPLKDKYLPVIAGKIGGLYPGEELVTFEVEFNEELSEVICHPLRIAVIAETGEEIFTVLPTKHG